LHQFSVVLAVFEPAVGKRGKIGVVAEDFLRACEFVQLNEEAVAANIGV
jgi:hypothetical protein